MFASMHIMHAINFSAVQIVFFHFESNIAPLLEISNQIELFLSISKVTFVKQFQQFSGTRDPFYPDPFYRLPQVVVFFQY